MPGFKFSTEIEGVKETVAMFDGIKAGMLDLRQLGAWKGVASEFRKVMREQFGSEGGAGKSGKWRALKPAYAKRKAAKFGNMPILQATGKMFRSLSTEGGDHVFEESAQEMAIGTRDKKAGYHQKGGGRLPARPIIDFTDAQEAALMKPIQDKLKQLAGNAKLRSLRGF